MRAIRSRLLWIAAFAAASLPSLVPRHVTRRAPDPVTGHMRDTTFRRVPISLGLDLRGGIHLGRAGKARSVAQQIVQQAGS